MISSGYFIKVDYIPFVNRSGGKVRPVLIHYDGKYINVWKITSKYISKSKRIQQQYFPIFKWHPYGLNKTSYVDIKNSIKMPYYVYLKLDLCKQDPIWYFDYNDIESFINFCNSYPKRIHSLNHK